MAGDNIGLQASFFGIRANTSPPSIKYWNIISHGVHVPCLTVYHAETTLNISLNSGSISEVIPYNQVYISETKLMVSLENSACKIARKLVMN